MYRFLEHDPAARLPSACEIYEKAVSLFGMSKTFGLAGPASAGWRPSDGDLLSRMAMLKDYTTICSSAPSEILSIIALRAKDVIIAAAPGTHSEEPGAAGWLLCALLGQVFVGKAASGDDRLSAAERRATRWTFCQQVIRDTNIMLLPSTVYGYDSSHFRIGFGRENMGEALGRLEEYLRA